VGLGDGLSIGRPLSEGAVLATADGFGVYGWSGTNNGVKGWSTLAGASGVYGESTAASGYGVFGQSQDGVGVAGTSTNGNGVRGVQGNGQYYASGPAGVVGVSISPVAPEFHVWTDEVGVAGFGAGSGVRGHSLTGDGVSGNSTDGPGVAGSSANGRGVEGFSSSANQWAPAVYGSHDGAGDGVYGVSENRHGVYGVTKSTASDSVGVYARNDGGGAAVHSDGDLYVTGAFRGNLGSSGGAPFPKPAWPGDFFAIDPGECFTVYHNLGGDQNDYVVDLQFRNADGIHTRSYGGLVGYLPPDHKSLGAFYEGLTNQEITLCRWEDDSNVHEIRVRIWKIVE
jgi:hypothetical protein